MADITRHRGFFKIPFSFALAVFTVCISTAVLFTTQDRDAMNHLAMVSTVSNADTTVATSTATAVTAPTIPHEEINISVTHTIECSDVWVEAHASVEAPGEIVSLSCVLSDEAGLPVYSDTTTTGDGKWEIINQQGNSTLTVTAVTAAGNTESWQQQVTFTPSEFVWPVEPEYQMLLHDRYQVSSGNKAVGGYTHNNGLSREKHYVFGNRRNHYGFDITAKPGSTVVAVADGTVLGIYKDTDSIGSTGYGNYIIIRHKNKHNEMTVYTLYAHLSKVTVSAGQSISQGEQVALSGNTGGSRIPHLHLEFRLGSNNKNATIDPLEVLPNRDFSIRKAALDADDGFATSSIRLHADMLVNGWDYTIFGRMLKEVKYSGVVIPVGAEVEIISRTDSTLTCSFNGTQFKCDASSVEYTYDVQ